MKIVFVGMRGAIDVISDELEAVFLRTADDFKEFFSGKKGKIAVMHAEDIESALDILKTEEIEPYGTIFISVTRAVLVSDRKKLCQDSTNLFSGSVYPYKTIA